MHLERRLWYTILLLIVGFELEAVRHSFAVDQRWRLWDLLVIWWLDSSCGTCCDGTKADSKHKVGLVGRVGDQYLSRYKRNELPPYTSGCQKQC